MMDDGYNLKKINSIKDVLLQRDQTLLLYRNWVLKSCMPVMLSASEGNVLLMTR